MFSLSFIVPARRRNTQTRLSRFHYLFYFSICVFWPWKSDWVKACSRGDSVDVAGKRSNAASGVRPPCVLLALGRVADLPHVAASPRPGRRVSEKLVKSVSRGGGGDTMLGGGWRTLLWGRFCFWANIPFLSPLPLSPPLSPISSTP